MNPVTRTTILSCSIYLLCLFPLSAHAILEAEKILGTIHIALGDNTGFGGTVSAPFHEDYVFYQPTLTAIMADGSEQIIIENGTSH